MVPTFKVESWGTPLTAFEPTKLKLPPPSVTFPIVPRLVPGLALALTVSAPPVLAIKAAVPVLPGASTTSVPPMLMVKVLPAANVFEPPRLSSCTNPPEMVAARGVLLLLASGTRMVSVPVLVISRIDDRVGLESGVIQREGIVAARRFQDGHVAGRVEVDFTHAEAGVQSRWVGNRPHELGDVAGQSRSKPVIANPVDRVAPFETHAHRRTRGVPLGNREQRPLFQLLKKQPFGLAGFRRLPLSAAGCPLTTELMHQLTP